MQARPCPGAFLLCAEALCLGAASASTSVLKGECSVEDWGLRFREESVQAADAAQPICGFMLRENIFNGRE
jgi:hypothetical protein